MTKITSFVTTPDIVDVENIELDGSSPYKFVDPLPGPGSLDWRKREARSPIVHGATLLGAVKEMLTIPMKIAVLGGTPENLLARSSLLCRAFEQFRYRLNITYDGVEHEWYCGPARYHPGDAGDYDCAWLSSFIVVYTFQIPRDPIPIKGPY